MAQGLLAADIELGVVAPGPVRQLTRRNGRGPTQWLVPSCQPSMRNGLPPSAVVQAIVIAAKKFAPDLVHTWGTEMCWGLLSARGLLSFPAILETQGLKSRIAPVFYGGLALAERLQCIGLKEILKRRTMRGAQHEFAQWRPFEEEIIRGHRYVDVQSEWIASHVRAINPDARLFAIDLALRRPFYEGAGWQPPTQPQPTIFCTAAYPSPFKGVHVAIRALGVLKRRLPNAHLRIAGAHQRHGIRQEGYVRWLNGLVRQLGLTDAIEWLGPLNAEQIVAELKRAGAVVIPTFIENCCTAMQEAMAIGTPVVVSYAGGIPSLAKDEESCLFFPPGDEAMCAYQLERVLTDRHLAERLSRESRKIAAVRNDRGRLVQRQLEIYRQVLAAR